MANQTDVQIMNPDTPERIGAYRIEGILGRGGMGVVYRAADPESGLMVALKTVFAPNERQSMSLRREIRALAQLHHPGVVKIIDEGVANGLPWYAMEFIDGIPLDQYCADVIWKGTGFEAHWTQATRRQFKHGTSSISGSDQPWIESLKTTLDSDAFQPAQPAVIPSTGISVPVVLPNRCEAAGGRLKDVLTVFNSICLTLSYIHGHGIVHRDLKPSNIIVRSDGTPVLIDFGLMLEFWGKVSRDDLESIRSTGGTLFYIAPEQILGDAIDARADLYALGCMLYEFVTGQRPFEAASAMQAIEAHLRLVQVPPSKLVDSVPPELEELILSLLQKKPHDRIGYADDVSRRLNALGAGSGFTQPLPRSKDYLYRPRFAGREGSISAINDLAEQAIAGQGRCVMIGGAGGIGKTRLLREIFRMVQRKHIRVLSGEFQPGLEPHAGVSRVADRIPFGALRQSMRELIDECLTQPDSPMTHTMLLNGAILSRFFPDMLRLPGIVAPEHQEEADLNAARMRVFQAITSVIQTLAAQRTVLLLLDDLQWIDDLSKDLIMFQIRTGFFTRNRVILIGSYRPEELSPAVERLVSSPQSTHIELVRLDESAVKTIIADMLVKSSPARRFVHFLTRFSEGNPFFICEYLRACIDENLLFRDASGQWQIAKPTDEGVTNEEIESLPLPSTLLNLVERRLDVLSPAAMSLAKTMSAIDRELDVMLLWTVIPFEDTMLDAMDELIQRQIVSESSPGYVKFVHDILFVRLYESIDPQDRAGIHLRIAEAIEMSFPDFGREHPDIMARHWRQAGEISRAAAYYLEAAEKATGTYRPADAEKMYRAYFEIVTEATPASIRAMNQYARNVLRFQARSAEAYRIHLRAFIQAKKLGALREQADSIIGISQYQVIKGQHRRAKLLVMRAMELFQLVGDEDGELKAVKRLAFILSREGASSEAEHLLREALDASIHRHDQRTEASLLSELGTLLQRDARYDEALNAFIRAMDIQHALGNRHLEARDMKSLAMIHNSRGDLRLAEQICERAMEIFREIGDTAQEGQLAYTLAGIVHAQGMFDRARNLYENALAFRRIHEDKLGEGLIHTRLGDVLRDMAAFPEADQAYRLAIALFEQLDLEHYARYPLTGLASLERLVRNDPVSARALLDRAKRLSEPIRDHACQVMIACEYGHLLLALNLDADDELRRAQGLIEKHLLATHRDARSACDRLSAALKPENRPRLFRGELVELRSQSIRDWYRSGTG